MISALDRLALEIEAESDSARQGCLIAKRAIHLARLGNVTAAAGVAGALRSRFHTEDSRELTCWLCLLDGLVVFDARPDPISFDRIRRAYQLSRGLQNSEIGVLSSAWLAHIEFNRGHVLESCGLNREGLLAAGPSLAGVLSRLALNIGDLHGWSGDPSAASGWYAAARQQAVADGDRVAFGTALHNFVALRIHGLRRAYAVDGCRPSKDDWAEMALNSSRNYNEGMHLTAFVAPEPLLRAQLLVALERYPEALEILNDRIGGPENPSPGRWGALALADRLLCETRLGRGVDVGVALAQIEAALHDTIDRDERGFVYSVMAEACALTGASEQATDYAVCMEREFGAHQARMDLIGAQFRDFRFRLQDWDGLYGAA